MKARAIFAALAAGLMMGALAAQAKLPAPPPKTDAEKAADAAKAAAAKAKAAELDAKYEAKAVANYKKNKGMATPAAMPAKPEPASMTGKK